MNIKIHYIYALYVGLHWADLASDTCIKHLESRGADSSYSGYIRVCVNAVHFQKALEFQNMPLTMDEVECLVANLIYRGYVKGYIAHSRRILVCSKVEPFPALKAANVSDLL